MRLFAPLIVSAALAFALPSAALAGAGTGTFTGASGHVTTGSVEVVQTSAGWEIHLKDDFNFDGAPDPRVGFGNGGTFAAGTDFESLRENTGAQVYQVPAEINPEDFDTVFIWCRQFSVPLGSAPIGN